MKFLKQPHPLMILALFVLLIHPTHAAVTEAWTRRYSNATSNSTDQAFKVVRDAAGDIIVTGNTSDGATGGALTIKYSGIDGSVLWQKLGTNGVAPVLAVDGSGNIAVAGPSYVAKYAAADGAVLWERHFHGAASLSIDYFGGLAMDTGGNVIVSGTLFNGTNYTAKYASGNGALLWEARNRGDFFNSFDYVAAVAVDGSANVIVTGRTEHPGRSTPDYYTAKFASATGARLWEKRYDSPDPEGRGQDEAKALAVDSSGNVVVTGYSGRDYYTAKYAAANGALVWEKRFNGLNPDVASSKAYAVVVDGSGNVIVTGAAYSDNNDSTTSDYYTAKYASANGALLWEKRYNGPANNEDRAGAITVDANGNVLVTGVSSTGDGLEGYRIFDYYTAKYAAANGALLWERRYSLGANSDDQAQSIVVDAGGNVAVTGFSGKVFVGDYYTAKYAAANGAVLWEQRYDGPTPQEDQAQAVAFDGNGNVVVTGFSFSDAGGRDYYTAKYARGDGSLLWEKRYNSPWNDSDEAKSIAVDAAGNVVVTGNSVSASGYDYYTAKYAASNGALLWEKRYDGPNNSYDSPQAVALDGSGNVIVTGTSDNGTNNDYYTVKYAAANGAVLWEKRYIAPSNSHSEAQALAVDGNGNAIVTGYSANGSGADFPNDYYTVKYASSDGALLWEKRYNGPINSDDSASAVAVDSSGNVVVTGSSYSVDPFAGGTPDFYTVKYAAADGALLWEKRDNTNGVANAVAIDAGGNVVVTGTSYNPDSTTDIYTAKYAANGALLWQKRYDGPAAGTDIARAVAFDVSGSVVIAGTSASAESGDYYVAKYAAGDGAVVWETRYNGPANGEDVVNTKGSLALGPNGAVAIAGTSSGSYGLGTFSYDYATVVYWENLDPIGITPDGPGGYFVRGNGIPGLIYQLQRAAEVTGPWTSNATSTATLAGLVGFHATNPPSGNAFYRIARP